MLQVKRTRSVTVAPSKHTTSKRRKTIEKAQQIERAETLPTVQSALQLHAIRQPYEVSNNQPLPKIQHNSELLIKVQAIGLNPIDWKAPYAINPPTNSQTHTLTNIQRLQLRHPNPPPHLRPRVRRHSNNSTNHAIISAQKRRSRPRPLNRLPRPPQSRLPALQHLHHTHHHPPAPQPRHTLRQHPRRSLCLRRPHPRHLPWPILLLHRKWT
jgi:hypothetical protein